MGLHICLTAATQSQWNTQAYSFPVSRSHILHHRTRKQKKYFSYQLILVRNYTLVSLQNHEIVYFYSQLMYFINKNTLECEATPFRCSVKHKTFNVKCFYLTHGVLQSLQQGVLTVLSIENVPFTISEMNTREIVSQFPRLFSII